MSGPLDARLDRRLFLRRMGALTAAASAGAIHPTRAAAAEVNSGQPSVPSFRLPDPGLLLSGFQAFQCILLH